MKQFNTNGLETVLEKVARSLADKFGITVVFQGDLCCTNGKTIFLPSLPDDLPHELLMVIRGWLDHEASHILFQSDMSLAGKFQKAHGSAAFCVLNILEDARVEAAICNRFAGSGFNLRACYAEAASKAEKAAHKKQLPLLRQLTFAIYACVNNLPYQDFVEWTARELVDELAPLIRQAPACANTREVEDIALKVWKRIQHLVDAEEAARQAAQAQDGKAIAADPSASGSGDAKGEGKTGVRGDSAIDGVHQGIIGGMAEDIAQAICGHARTNQSYRVWSTAHDQVSLGRNQSSRSHQDRMRDILPLVSGVRQKLLQSLLAEPKARWLGDREQGAVNPRCLHRLALPNSEHQHRIFRQRVRTRRLRTAVTLLVDESSSMGSAKLRLAEKTAMVFCEALARLNIVTSVIGFSTMKYTLEKIASKQMGMPAAEIRNRFRLHPLCHTIYKRFGESFAKVSARMEDMTAKSITPLGESMLFAARQLVGRPEERKVLFVMTDGRPVTGINPEDVAFAHAKRAIVRIEKAGIDVALVGIMEPSVHDLHHRSVVVPSLDQLPRTVMNQLQSVLTKPIHM